MKRVQAIKRFLHFGLTNSRSLLHNAFPIQLHILYYDLDILTFTESWLNSESGNNILQEFCPISSSNQARPLLADA